MSIESIMRNNLQIVKDFCKDTLIGTECPFYNHTANCCEFSPDPMNWDLTDFEENSDYEGLLDDDEPDWYDGEI